MKRINVLNEDTFNKIAAGEVVERPFSVVKELVENSIDAKAKNIFVEVEDGGKQLIRVTDDGNGIHPDDIQKAFMPHATSKINDLDDIYKVSTMGFRGEALASIASISHTVLKSRTSDFDFGKEIIIDGGTVNGMNEVAANVGTSVEVKDIFFNVPARQKFLKSSSREISYISDIVNRLALCNPDISFKLINNGKKSVNTYGTSNLIDAVRSIYGKSVCDNIINFEKHFDIVSIYGYIGNSDISRGSRNNQSTFVNKRYIKSKLITAAVENAFKSFITINKHPFFILFLDVFPEYIDVNVHPTKSEVKFRDDRYVFKIVFDTVHEALRESIKNSFNIESNIAMESDNILNKSIDKIKDKTNEESRIVQIPIDLQADKKSYYINKESGNNDNYTIHNEYSTPNINETSYKNNLGINYESNHTDTVKENTDHSLMPKFPKLNIIGQFHSTYILCEYDDTLYVIDQHAAHEKILFEKYKKDIKKNKIVSQLLISPAILELSTDDFSYYIDNKDLFKNAGFHIELFGENTLSIREVPMILGKPDFKRLFIDILDNLKNMGSGETWEVKYDVIAKLACKAAIKANDNLSSLEMNHIVDELRFLDDPFTCPHGRPTIIKVTLNQFEKKFKRIQ